MSMFPDRYRTVGRRDFATAVEYMLETEFKLVGSHRVIRMIVESIMDLHREFFPETKHRKPGTILWARRRQEMERRSVGVSERNRMVSRWFSYPW